MKQIFIVESAEIGTCHHIIGTFFPSARGFAGNLEKTEKILTDYFQNYLVNNIRQIEDSGIEITMEIEEGKFKHAIIVTSHEIID